ncbi:MAG: hypothetical protein V8R81_01715 [Clostridia bacterium]
MSKKVDKQFEERKKKWNKDYNRKRYSKYATFYNCDEWKNLKNKYLQDHEYRCEKCQEKKKENPEYKEKIAEEVHHKEPIQTPEGWIKRFEYKGLKALCHDCHNEEHNRFQKRKKVE